ncbi:MAG: metal-dependent hydrolase [Halobacteriales archaeon]
MWPWGHLALGYLLYSLELRRRGRVPEAPEVFLVAVGTQYPDLVDKPLAWTFGVLHSGRSLGHSVLFAGIVLALLYVFLVPRIDRSKLIAFAVGWLSHPLGDLPFRGFLAGDAVAPTYLAWPLLPVPADETERTLLTYILTYDYGLWEVFEFGLFVLAVVVWLYDDRPGWNHVRRFVRR